MDHFLQNMFSVGLTIQLQPSWKCTQAFARPIANLEIHIHERKSEIYHWEERASLRPGTDWVQPFLIIDDPNVSSPSLHRDLLSQKKSPLAQSFFLLKFKAGFEMFQDVLDIAITHTQIYIINVHIR